MINENLFPLEQDTWKHRLYDQSFDWNIIFERIVQRLRYNKDSFKELKLLLQMPDICPIRMMETYKSNWLGREVADIEVDCFLPGHWIKTSYFNTKPFFLPFLSFTLTLAWKDNTIIQISEIIAKREVGKLCLSYFWICHKKFLPIHEQVPP